MSERIWLVRDREKTYDSDIEEKVHKWHGNSNCKKLAEIFDKGNELLVLSAFVEKDFIPEKESKCKDCTKESFAPILTSALREKGLIP